MEIDKIYHWAFGFVLSITIFLYEPLWLLGPAFGVGKELYDMKIGKPFDMLDLAFTAVGSLNAFALYIIIL